MDPVSEAALDLLSPQLAAKVRTLAEMMEVAGEPIKVVQGLRSWDQQAKLYAQGRTAPGPIVTHAPPGHSWHQFGLAVDCVPVSLLPFRNWCPESPLWEEMGRKGESLGLTWGGRWQASKIDRPHFQLSGSFPDSPNDEVRQVFMAVGMTGVWKEAGLDFSEDKNA